MRQHRSAARAFVWLGLTGLLLQPGFQGFALSQGKVPAVPPDHAARMAKGLDLFKKQVRPILEQKCLRCHGGRTIESQFDLSDRDGLLKGGQVGPAVVVGKAKESLLYKLITHKREPFMPHNAAPLPAAAIAQIADWIDLGAPYDVPLVAAKVKAPSWTEKVLPAAAREFWSFQPLKLTAPPAVSDAPWCKTTVDRFVLARLEAAGLAANPLASREKLIRRAYYDLTGLPPSPQEVQAFINDSKADAFDRLIDRLLASPHYGERWARHWLDLARFAESHGFEHDYDRPSAYHYRDFVIEALNQGMPYDTFVKWQVAGDEFAPENPLALKATGFLAAGVHSTQITKNEVEKHRYDELDDKLATIGTAMLGLTIGCARCHDHKFDPIPQRDYYRLLSTFTTTVRSEIDLNLDPDGYRTAKAAFDQQHAPYRAALKKFEDEQLSARLASWERGDSAFGLPLNGKSIPWDIVEIVDAKSKDGTTLTPQGNGSVLASGKNPKVDTYTLVVHTRLTGITGIRLEALADPSLVKSGPGRAANGNFALTDFKVTVAPLKAAGAESKPVSLTLANPRATFEQQGLPVKAAIDKDAKSGWAIDPQFGRDHAAVFELGTPIGFPGGSLLTFTLAFQNNDGHAIARPRLSVSTMPAPDLAAPGILEKVRPILSIPAAKRNADETARLLQWYRTIDPDWRKLNQQMLDHLAKAPRPQTVKTLIASEGLPAVRLHTQGEDFFPETFFLRRGDSAMKEGVASQGFLQVLMPGADAAKQWQTSPPAGGRTSYRRRAFAGWLTDSEHGAGLLLARVIVNRLWQHHLGEGIVRTPSDFGARGEPPTHPELLDFLAHQLIQNGWRLKHIHKLIMTSAVYRQTSQFSDAKAKLDRDNKLLWRFAPRRLEAEIIRDSLLSVSGALDTRMFGPGTFDETSRRRSIYFTVKRSKLMPMMVIFDAPEGLSSMGDRPTTTIAPQALHLMNNPQVRAWAQSFAKRIVPTTGATLEDAVRSAYLIALSRQPSPAELTDSLAFVQRQEATYSADGRQHALADFCQVLMCLNEFVYVE